MQGGYYENRFLFAGQEVRRSEWAGHFMTAPSARRVFDKAELDFDLKELCFYGPAEN